MTQAPAGQGEGQPRSCIPASPGVGSSLACGLSSQTELPSNIEVPSLSSQEVTAQPCPPWRTEEKSWTGSRAPGTSFRADLGRFSLQWSEAAVLALLQPHTSKDV